MPLSPPLFHLAHLPLSFCVILYLPHPSPLTLLTLTVMEETLDVPAIKLMLVALLCRRILHRRIVLEREEAKINDKTVTKRHRDPNRRRNRQFGLEWLADENVKCRILLRYEQSFATSKDVFAWIANVSQNCTYRIPILEPYSHKCKASHSG